MATDGVPRALTMPDGAGERGDVVIADHLGEGDGGDVERVCDGGGRRDHAGVLALSKLPGV